MTTKRQDPSQNYGTKTLKGSLTEKSLCLLQHPPSMKSSSEAENRSLSTNLVLLHGTASAQTRTALSMAPGAEGTFNCP